MPGGGVLLGENETAGRRAARRGSGAGVACGVGVTLAGHRAAGEAAVMGTGDDRGPGSGHTRQHDGDVVGNAPCTQQGGPGHSDQQRRIANGAEPDDHGKDYGECDG